MKLMHTFLLALILFVTACAKQPSLSQNTSKPSRAILNKTAETDTSAPTIKPTEEAPNSIETPGTEEKLPQVITTSSNNTIASPPSSNNIKSAPVTVEDMFDRLRRGFTLPRFDSKDVDTYVRWNTSHETYLSNLFNRGQPFLYHIIEQLEARNMPMEIALLPAVESAYKSNAVSRSKAAGLWQFIPSTGREFGLSQTWWYDGRLDAVRATSAALDYLEQLNKIFDGDWWLTLAAYNAGPATIKKAIAANKRKGLALDYKSLRLRSETRRYVPKLVALRRIIQQPHNFNVDLPRLPLKPGFAVISLDQQIDLRKFAQRSNTDLKQLRHLNASFKRWATPPQGDYSILVPQPHDLSYARLKDIALNESNINYLRHQIVSGDNLGSIAKKYGVSTNEIRKANQLKSSFIRAGGTLLVPKVDNIDTSNLATAQSSKKVTHTVSAGDTLWSISRRYNVGVQQLIDWNHLALDQILRLNQQLLVLLK